MAITAIETEYAGCRFRSRTGADADHVAPSTREVAGRAGAVSVTMPEGKAS